MGRMRLLCAVTVALIFACLSMGGAQALFIDYERADWPLSIEIQGDAKGFALEGETLKIPALALLYFESGNPVVGTQPEAELKEDVAHAVFDALSRARVRTATKKENARISGAWLSFAARIPSGEIMDITFYPGKNDAGTIVLIEQGHPVPSPGDEAQRFFVQSRELRALLDAVCGHTPYRRAELKKAERIDVYRLRDQENNALNAPLLIGTIDRAKAVKRVTSAIAGAKENEGCNCPFTVKLVFTLGDGSALEAYVRYPGHSKKQLDVRAGNAQVSAKTGPLSPIVNLLK